MRVSAGAAFVRSGAPHTGQSHTIAFGVPALVCFIIAGDPDEARVLELSRLAQSLGYGVRLAATVEALRSDAAFADAVRPLVLIPDLAGGGEAAIRFAQEEPGRAFVVCVASALAPDVYKALVRSGGEWAAWETCAQELRDLTRNLATAEVPERAAKVISFRPSKGGVGNTTLVLETGIHLASRRKGAGRIALLDLNLQGGTLADALDIEPRFDVAEIVAKPERLDAQLIDIFTSRYAPRLDLFAAPTRRIALGDVPAQIVFTVIDTIAKRYEAILIDLPQAFVPWADNIVQGSDAVVLTGGATVPALRRLTLALGQLDALDIPSNRLAVAVNACEADLLGRVARRREIERALGARETFLVRADAATACGALDAGRAILESAPNARISRDIRKLADWCATAAGLP